MRKTIFVIIIACLVLAPALMAIFGIGAMDNEEMKNMENRRLAELNKIENLPGWLEDRIGFRKTYINLYNSIIYDIFGESPKPELAQAGKNGFLFAGSNFENTFALHSGTAKLDPQLLDRLCAQLDDFIKKANQYGIPVILAIAPDKATIYGDYYPGWVKEPVSALPEKFLLERFKDNIVIMEKNFRKYRQENPEKLLFHKTDTHWTQRGALLGYLEIMDAIQNTVFKDRGTLYKAYYDKPFFEYKPHLDLQRLLGLKIDEKVEYLTLKPSITKQINEFLNIKGYRPVKIWHTETALNNFKVLIFHDSFYAFFPETFMLTFSDIIAVDFNGIDENVLNRALRDNRDIGLILFICVERNIPQALSRYLEKLGTNFPDRTKGEDGLLNN